MTLLGLHALTLISPWGCAPLVHLASHPLVLADGNNILIFENMASLFLFLNTAILQKACLLLGQETRYPPSTDKVLEQWFSTRFGVRQLSHRGHISDILHTRYLHYSSSQKQNYSYEVARK